MEILIRKGFSLDNVDRQLKEVTGYANKNMANSNFLGVIPRQNMEARIKIQQVLFQIK